MSNLLFLLGVLVLSGLGTAAIVLRNRQPKSVDAGVKAFAREMRALSPESRRTVGGRSAEPAPGRRPAGRVDRGVDPGS